MIEYVKHYCTEVEALNLLNHMGLLNWTLCAISDGAYYFKREKIKREKSTVEVSAPKAPDLANTDQLKASIDRLTTRQIEITKQTVVDCLDWFRTHPEHDNVPSSSIFDLFEKQYNFKLEKITLHGDVIFELANHQEFIEFMKSDRKQIPFDKLLNEEWLWFDKEYNLLMRSQDFNAANEKGTYPCKLYRFKALSLKK